MTKIDIANSNIVALCATLLVRLICGPACDRFGARWTFAGTLVIGAIPTFLAGTCYTKSQLFACRFFVGILGGSFVPCQVWSTGFFDKNIVGTANAIIAGFGNAGGGVTYFLMPTIYDSLVHDQGYSPHVAWRITFIVPGVIILVVASGLFFLCEDTPTGSWQTRHLAVDQNLASQIDNTNNNTTMTTMVDAPTGIKSTSPSSPSGSASPNDLEKAGSPRKLSTHSDHPPVLDTAAGEIVQSPTWSQTFRVMTQPQTLVLAFSYFNSFGAELAINSILGAYYQHNFPSLGQTHSGQWAAMFGLLNVVTRPLGGICADLIYKATNTDGSQRGLWAKKIWIHALGIVAGAMCVAIGVLDTKSQSTMFGLVAGMAVFLEAGNGANFALVPHVNPGSNGVVSGVTGATGNLGGIVFAVVFRYVSYGKGVWIVGVIGMCMHLCFLVVRPVSRKQVGGH